MTWKTIYESVTVHYPHFTMTGSIEHDPAQASLAQVDAETGEDEVLSVDLSGYGYVPGPDEVFVKDWSEHHGFGCRAMARCIDCRERDASSTKTLCQRCYKRRLGGRPRLITLRRVGDPDGHGQYGILDVDEESVLCHECGRRLRGLGTHLLKAHNMTAADYRDAHGLPRGLPLTCLETQRTVSEQARARIGTPGWEAFEAACDPVAAAHARGTWTLAPALVAARTGVPGPSRPRILRTCRYCSVEYTGKRRTAVVPRLEDLSEHESLDQEDPVDVESPEPAEDAPWERKMEPRR